jgi:hypothetical protein
MGIFGMFKRQDAPKEKPPTLATCGGRGLRHSGGRLEEEWHKRLSGYQAVQVYREMSDNDPVIGGFMFALENLAGSAEAKFEPADASPRAVEIAEFFESCRGDMESSWSQVFGEILQAAVYGWDMLEVIYKLRRGPAENSTMFRSKHSDGLWGWRDWSPRPQDTLDRWEIDGDKVVGMHQLVPPHYERRFVPLDKALLFRFRARKGSPEGRSLLRNAYRSWYFCKKLEELEAIRCERDAAGVLKISVPPSMLSPNATSAEKAVVSDFEAMGKRFKLNEQACIVVPNETDPQTQQPSGYKVEPIPTSKNVADTDGIIRRHQSRMLVSLLSEFLLLGMDKVGSFALSSDKTDLFAIALGRILSAISDEINRKAVADLMEMNRWPVELAPRHVFGDVEKADVEKFVANLSGAVAAGLVVNDATIEDATREALGLPARDDGDKPAAQEVEHV